MVLLEKAGLAWTRKRYIFPVCVILWNPLESQNSRRSPISSAFLPPFTCHISEKIHYRTYFNSNFKNDILIFKSAYDILWKNIPSPSILNGFLFHWVWYRLPDIFRLLSGLHFPSGFPGESCGNWNGSPRDHNIFWVSTSSSTSDAAIERISNSIPGKKSCRLFDEFYHKRA